EPLPFKQRDMSINGHAIECLINAENPERNLAPSPGTIEPFAAPGGLGVRMDTHVVPGYRVPLTYDSMIAKLIVHAPTREACIRRTKRALSEMRIEPIHTTIGLHMQLMDNASFKKGGMDIHFLERLL